MVCFVVFMLSILDEILLSIYQCGCVIHSWLILSFIYPYDSDFRHSESFLKDVGLLINSLRSSDAIWT